MPELTGMPTPHLYSLRTACAYILHMNMVSASTADELQVLEADIQRELDQRPRGT